MGGFGRSGDTAPVGELFRLQCTSTSVKYTGRRTEDATG
jgi:hypothetical protein